MKATWNGTVVAESDDTVVAEGNHYFPKESVNPAYLTAEIKDRIAFWRGVRVSN
jgi:uncharacterized protein (DUF427 family)